VRRATRGAKEKTFDAKVFFFFGAGRDARDELKNPAAPRAYTIANVH